MSQWQQFSGLQNTEYVLAEKAEALGRFLLDWAVEFNGLIITQLKSMPAFTKILKRSIGGEIYVDCVFIGLHWADRVAASILSHDDRMTFLALLTLKVADQMNVTTRKVGLPMRNLSTVLRHFSSAILEVYFALQFPRFLPISYL